MVKSECIKQEPSLPQIPQHMSIQSKEHQGIGAYTNMYQRHPMTLASQQLSREEELRRFVKIYFYFICDICIYEYI